MTDRVHPSTKPILQQSTNGGSAAATTTTNGRGARETPSGTQYVPPPKPQIYPNTRPVNQRPYRPRQPPPPPPRRRCCNPRKCCCLCIIYTILILLIIILLAAITATIFYFLYRPKHPTFSITSAKISTFNLTSSPDGAVFSHLDSHIDFTLSAKNPNDKIKFTYSNLLFTATASTTAYAGTGEIPGFLHLPSNTTMIIAAVVGDRKKDLDSDSVAQLKTDLEKKGGEFPLSLEVDTKVKVKFGNLESNRVGLRVVCVGMKGTVPKKSTTNSTKKGVAPKIVPSVVVISDHKCKVDFRIKIWRFTF